MSGLAERRKGSLLAAAGRPVADSTAYASEVVEGGRRGIVPGSLESDPVGL